MYANYFFMTVKILARQSEDKLEILNSKFIFNFFNMIYFCFIF